MNVYSKRKDGTYAIKSDVLDLKPGTVVEVETKGGNIKMETIGAKVWEGEDRFNPGQTIAIYTKEQAGSARPTKSFTCAFCGEANLHDHPRCWECGSERPGEVPAAKQYQTTDNELPF